MVYKFYSGNNQVPKKKRTYNYMSVLPLPNRSDRFLQPVRPVCMETLREHRSDRYTDRSGKNRGLHT